MKKGLISALALTTAMSVFAASNVVMPVSKKAPNAKMTKEMTTTASKAKKAAQKGSLRFDPYYPAPDGVLYLGLGPKAEKSGSYYALAPLNRELTFKSGFDDGDYTWDYYDENDKNHEVDNKDITLTFSEKGAYEAPTLFCIGYGGRGTYSFALDGIAAGYGYLPNSSGTEYYGTNINTYELTTQFYDPTTLSINSETANTALAKHYGSSIQNLKIQGFAESFSFCGDYSLDAVRADMFYDDGTADPSHFVAEVYPFVDNAVDFSKKIATLPAVKVTKHDYDFYCYEFTSDEAPRITTPIMIVFRPTDACTSIVSPGQYPNDELHDADKGTAYMYASYDMGSSHVDNGILAYYGIELEGRRGVYYHNHWNVSIKRTYLEDLPEVPTTAYAYQMGDQAGKFGFITFPVNDLSDITLAKSVSSSASQVGAGEYVDGLYYTYTLYQDYLYGDGLAVDQFVVYDTKNDFTVKKAVELNNAPRIADMAFDYTTNTMFALIEQNKDDAGRIGLTALGAVNLETGDVTVIGLPGDIRALNGNGKDVEEHLIALAVSPEGQLYAMGEYRQLYTLNKRTGAATAVGQRKRVAVINDFQTMAFNAKGELYYAHMHPDYEYFMQIDPATGNQYNPVTGEEVVVNSDFTNNAHRITNDPQIVGLYFADQEVNGAAPLAATLSATLRNGTPDKVDLEWTLPTMTFDGKAVNITSVVVYRLGTEEPLATLPASATAFTDNQAPNGEVSYSVVCMAGENAGFPAFATVFAGADQLMAVNNLTAVLNGNDLTLSWDAPKQTVNGGYADFDNITYRIHRISGDARTKLEEAHPENIYNANHTDVGTFSFEVVPVSAGVEGLPAVSNEVVLEGGAATIPYFTSFEDDQDGTLWTITNKSTGSYGWSIKLGYAYQRFDGKFAQFYTGGASTVPADDLFASPAINMEAGAYILKYYAAGGSYDTHTWKVWLGTDPVTLVSEIQSESEVKVNNTETGNINGYKLFTVNFNVENSGNQHIIFQGIGNATYATLKIDNLSIEKDPSGVDAVSSDVVASIKWDGAAKTAACAEAAAFEVYDLQGRKVAQAEGTSVSLANLGSGLYIVKAATPAGNVAVKVNVK